VGDPRPTRYAGGSARELGRVGSAIAIHAVRAAGRDAEVEKVIAGSARQGIAAGAGLDGKCDGGCRTAKEQAVGAAQPGGVHGKSRRGGEGVVDRDIVSVAGGEV